MASLSLRRTRLHPGLRQMAREAWPRVDQFVQPLFVVDGIAAREPVPGLDGVYRETPESLLRQINDDVDAGIEKFLLFGVPAEKRDGDFNHDFLCATIEMLRSQFGNAIWLATDVCLCSHTTHGHCGMLNEDGDHVVNDATVEELAAAAARHASAGADCVAPSDMMDGRVAAIRAALTAGGNDRVAIMSYAAKFHSGFYGPFRGAAGSAPAGDSILSDRASYQIDPSRPSDALLSACRDDDEGADILMVKPGLPYLDVLADLSTRIPKPWAVYQTSGEQAAIELLAQQGLAKRNIVQLESWIAFCRAGASIIISYAARHATAILK